MTEERLCASKGEGKEERKAKIRKEKREEKERKKKRKRRGKKEEKKGISPSERRKERRKGSVLEAAGDFFEHMSTANFAFCICGSAALLAN
jgi:hypothetical protein